MRFYSSGLLSFVAALALGLVMSSSVWAATVSGVAVAEGTSYTNVTVSATLSGVSGETLVYAVKDRAGTTLASVEAAAVEGANSAELDLGSLAGGADKNRFYYYEVSVKDASPAVAAGVYYANVGWGTNDFFRADATSGAGVYENGSWTAEPTIKDNAFSIAGSDAIFTLENVERGTGRDILDFCCKAGITGCYVLDDITNDVKGAFCGVSLVTNDSTETTAKWMVLKDCSNWVEAAGAATDCADYDLRMEVDYAATPSLIRYSVKKTADDAWSVLTVNGSEWVAATNGAPSVSEVGFGGTASVAKFCAKLSTTAVAEANGTGYADILAAMAATKESGKALVLFTNVRIDPSLLTAGDYAWRDNGKTFAVTERSWASGDKTAKTVAIDGDTLRVLEELLVAAIGEKAYVKLGTALASGADETVVLLTNVVENATSTVANVTLDLAGFSLAEASAEEPVLTAKGETATLRVVGGGAITGATVAAVCAFDGAVVALDGLLVTNNAGKAILASGAGSEVVVSNGWFEAAGSIVAEDSAKVLLVSGYYLDGTRIASDNVKGVGGKFTPAVTNYSQYAINLPADSYRFTLFAIPIATNGHTVVAEIVTNVTVGSTSVNTLVWPLSDDPSNAVQLPESFMTKVYPSWSSPAERTNAVNELNKPSSGYPAATKWQCYVLGMPDAAKPGAATTENGPRAEAVGAQDTSTTSIGFKMTTPGAVKAAESNCEVTYEVEEYKSADCTGTPENTSGRVNYDETAEIANPSGVRYYKMKVYISTKK